MVSKWVFTNFLGRQVDVPWQFVTVREGKVINWLHHIYSSNPFTSTARCGEAHSERASKSFLRRFHPNMGSPLLTPSNSCWFLGGVTPEIFPGNMQVFFSDAIKQNSKEFQVNKSHASCSGMFKLHESSLMCFLISFDCIWNTSPMVASDPF